MILSIFGSHEEWDHPTEGDRVNAVTALVFCPAMGCLQRGKMPKVSEWLVGRCLFSRSFNEYYSAASVVFLAII